VTPTPSAPAGTTEEPAAAKKPTNPYATMLAIMGGGLAMAFIIIAFGLATGDGDGGGGGDAAAPVAVTLSEFAIDGDLATTPGGTLAVTNAGSQVHNLVIEDGASTADLPAGESEDLTVDVAEGEHVVYCSIPGHREAGMEATLTVAEGVEVAAGAEGGEGEAATGGGSHYHTDLTPEKAKELDDAMMNSFTPFVEQIETGELNTEGLGGQDLEPTIGADGVKEWTLTAEITPWEVEPGKTVDAWTYNGTVPGPTLRGEVGDRIRIRLVNELPLSTDVHMHGMILPNDQDGVAPLTQDPIPPGEEFVYEYTVTEPGIAMYHPHMHGMQKIPDGMWGSMIFSPEGGGGSADYTIPRGRTISGVEIPADLQLAQEENMVLNDAGVIGLSLNGKSFPATEPYALKKGDWMLVNYYNEGSMYHPMHLHQFPQLVVARDGIPLDEPYFADTVTVGPGERYTVLFQAEQAGAWVWHCHILNHAESEQGMFGMVTALAVQ
jgi:uncharacterized cupredoxin-like copper-binding protein